MSGGGAEEDRGEGVERRDTAAALTRLRAAFPELEAADRAAGVTIALDTGHGPAEIADFAAVAGDYVDYAKIAWGSALITGHLEDKLAAYAEAGISPLLGGTLFEYAYLRGKVDDLVAFVRDTGMHVEVSDGVVDMPRGDKLRWIERLARHAPVFSEVGGKIASRSLDWGAAIREELAAGAAHIVVEGREIGPVGQEIRADVVEAALAAAPRERLVFEALERKQQVWLIKHIGPDVNLGNIRFADVLTLESFRRGLKEHTLLEARAWAARRARPEAR